MSRFVEITGKSKCRKESEINKGRELPESILTRSAKLNINENLNLNKSKQENIDIFTKSLLLEARGEYLGQMTASNFYRISTKTQGLQNNTSNNGNSLLKTLTEINKFEPKAIKHGTAMEPHAKLQVISILKKSHKNFTSTNLGLKVDRIYPYIAASPDLLVICHCCGNGAIEIKCPESVCETVPSKENLDYLIKDVDNLISLKRDRNYYAQIQGQMAIVNCIHSFLVFCLHIQWFKKTFFFDEIYWGSTLKKLAWFWHNELAPYLLYNKDHKNDTISFNKNSDLNLNDKEQSTSQNVASTTIKVGFPQNKKLKLNQLTYKKNPKNLKNLCTCMISVIKIVEKIQISLKKIELNATNVNDGFIFAV